MKKYLFTTFYLILILILFNNCASTTPAARSTTRELNIPQLDGTVYISAVHYCGSSIQIIKTMSYIKRIYTNDDTKQIAILAIQAQNLNSNRKYDLSSIVIFDKEKEYRPEHLRYFRGNSIFYDWDVISRRFFTPLAFTSKKNGIYTLNLIYAIDKSAIITGARLFDQTVEFESDFVSLNVIDKFN